VAIAYPNIVCFTCFVKFLRLTVTETFVSTNTYRNEIIQIIFAILKQAYWVISCRESSSKKLKTVVGVLAWLSGYSPLPNLDYQKKKEKSRISNRFFHSH
jgi:hypothetical protein